MTVNSKYRYYWLHAATLVFQMRSDLLPIGHPNRSVGHQLHSIGSFMPLKPNPDLAPTDRDPALPSFLQQLGATHHLQ